MVTMSSDDAGKVLSEMRGRYLDAKVNATYHYCYYYYYYYCLVGVQRGNTWAESWRMNGNWLCGS